MQIKSAKFHEGQQILVIGFKNGIFGIYKVLNTDFTLLQSF